MKHLIPHIDSHSHFINTNTPQSEEKYTSSYAYKMKCRKVIIQVEKNIQPSILASSKPSLDFTRPQPIPVWVSLLLLPGTECRVLSL